MTTPRNANPPLLALDGSGTSNLAQSCYYVADRDSEEDEEEQLAVQDEEELDVPGREEWEGWQGEVAETGGVDGQGQGQGNLAGLLGVRQEAGSATGGGEGGGDGAATSLQAAFLAAATAAGL